MDTDTHEFTPDFDLDLLKGNCEGSYVKIYQGVPGALGQAVATIECSLGQMRARGLVPTEGDVTESEQIEAIKAAIQTEMASNTITGSLNWTIRALAQKGSRSLGQRQCLVRAMDAPDAWSEPQTAPAPAPGLGSGFGTGYGDPLAALREGDVRGALPVLNAMYASFMLTVQAQGHATATQDEHYRRLLDLHHRAFAVMEDQLKHAGKEIAALRGEVEALRAENRRLRQANEDLLLDGGAAPAGSTRPAMDPERVERLAGQAKDTIAQIAGAFMPGGLRDVWAAAPDELKKQLQDPAMLATLRNPGKLAELVSALKLLKEA